MSDVTIQPGQRSPLSLSQDSPVVREEEPPVSLDHQEGSTEKAKEWVQPSDGSTALDMLWNAGVGAFRWATGSSEANERHPGEVRVTIPSAPDSPKTGGGPSPDPQGGQTGEVEVDKPPLSVDQDEKKPEEGTENTGLSIAQKLAEMEIKENAFPIEQLGMYLPEGWAIDGLVEALQNQTSNDENRLTVGKWNDHIQQFSDVVRDLLLPVMRNESVSMERKALELYRLAQLEDKPNECGGRTVHGALLECFNAMPEEQQNAFVQNIFKDVEDPKKAMQESTDKSVFVQAYNSFEASDEWDWACLEAMHFYAERFQPQMTHWCYQHLSEDAQAVLLRYEAQEVPPLEGEDAVEDRTTVYTGEDETVDLVGRTALNNILNAGFEDFEAKMTDSSDDETN